MASGGNAPIIIKRKRKAAAHGHHGGAWKVAYADFVTAMMAFFLMMWLLGATTEDQRQGLSDYFSPTVPIKRISGGGDDSFRGDSAMSEVRLAKSGVGASNTAHASNNRGMGATGLDPAEDGQEEADQEILKEVRDTLLARSGESMISDEMKQHMLMRVTDEGLVVELFDLPDRALFMGDGRPEPVLRDLIRAIGAAFGYASNDVAIKGYVRELPVVRESKRRFETSIARAETVRRLLTQVMDGGRIARITGRGDRQPAAADTTAVRNNRVELVLLRDGR